MVTTLRSALSNVQRKVSIAGPSGITRLRHFLSELPQPREQRAALLLAVVDPNGFMEGPAGGASNTHGLEGVSRDVLSWIWPDAGGMASASKAAPDASHQVDALPESRLREIALEVCLQAALSDPKWQSRSLTERLAFCERQLLSRFGKNDFRSLNEAGQTFLEWLQSREEVTTALFRSASKEAGAGAAQQGTEQQQCGFLAHVKAEAAEIWHQASEFCSATVPAADLARILAAQWQIGPPSAMEAIAQTVCATEASANPADGSWEGGAVITVGAALWGRKQQASEPVAPLLLQALSPLAPTTQSAESAAREALKAAPALVDLGDWLRWETCFAPLLGDLKGFLRRFAPALGLLVFDGPGCLCKVDVAAAASDAWEEALAARKTEAEVARIAEVLVANVHTFGADHLPSKFWRLYASSVQSSVEMGGKIERLQEASFIARLFKALPAPFRHSIALQDGLLRPFTRSLAEELYCKSDACSRPVLHAAGLRLKVARWIQGLRRHLEGSIDFPVQETAAVTLEEDVSLLAPPAPPQPPVPDIFHAPRPGGAALVLMEEEPDEEPQTSSRPTSCESRPLPFTASTHSPALAQRDGWHAGEDPIGEISF